MSYVEQLKRAKAIKQATNHSLLAQFANMNSGGSSNSFVVSNKEIRDKLLDDEIERLTELAIEEMIMQKLNSIDVSLTVDNEAVANAITAEIIKGLGS